MILHKTAASAATIALPLLALVSLMPRHALASENNVPKIIELGTDLGPVDAATEQNFTVFLKLHNEAALDRTIEALSDPESSNYHHWLTQADLEQYAPTGAEFESVKNELISHGFSVISADPQRLSIRVHGTTASAQTAFQTELHNFVYNGRRYQSQIRAAQLTGAAGSLVDAVSGLARHQIRPSAIIASNPITGKPLFTKKRVTTESAADLFGETTDEALSQATEYNYTTPGATLPEANYWGTAYGQNPNAVVSFTPAQLQAHYALAPLYKEGYNGAGQTIALVEAYGYAAAEADANVAARVFGLPVLNSSNFSVVYPEGRPSDPNAGELTGWSTEIALDIQSAHAIAPGAKIVVIASNGQDNEDLIASLQYVISHKVANSVSNSWEADTDLIAGPDEQKAFNAVLKQGAAAGISFQFSSGDGGDGGVGTPLGAPGVPSNSPYATAVGGTSILNNPYGTGQIVAGWGNDFVLINSFGVVDPPGGGFDGGAGGGQSVYFAKPSWQKALSGPGRHVPDVSALADPFTGFSVVVTEYGAQYGIAGIGGTSLASPIFTAIWAIANQYNGAPLGQAAPIVARLKKGQITDVVPTPASLTVYNASGSVHDSSGTTYYSPTVLFAGLLDSTTEFVSTLWNLDSVTSIALSFGTDSSLTVTPGWDNVTGYGEPNGLPFIQGVTGKTKGAAIEK